MTSDSELFDVVIVGCGPAGIAAAIEFQKKNSTLNFVLLEARDRVGGRVVTDTTTFAGNTPVDLGAQWLHHYRLENPLHTYHQSSRDAQINHHFILRTSTTPFFDIDGTKISTEKIEQAEAIFQRLCEKIEQACLSIDQSIFDVIKNECNQHEEDHDPQLKRLVDLFFGIIEQYEASNLDQLSAKSYLKSDNGLQECNLAMPNGFGQFVKQIVQQHQLPIQLSTIVTCIDTSSSDSIVRIYTKDQKVFLCKYVLVTIPLGCLKARSVEFRPTLPEWKQNAIDTMGVGLSDKIFLQFPYVFWNPQWTAIFCTSDRYRFILCRSDVCLLQIKLVARVAEDIELKSNEETLIEVMNLLRRIFSDRQVPEPNRYLITKWNRDEFARGSYSNFAVGADQQTSFDLARECHDRIHWAGEHTNYDGTIGCVDSAFESGQREAKRILKRIEL